MVQNEDSLAGGEKVWERQVGELGNVAHCKQGLTCWGGGRGRIGTVSSATWNSNKGGLTSWRGGGGRAGMWSGASGVARKGGSSEWGEREGLKWARARDQ